MWQRYSAMLATFLATGSIAGSAFAADQTLLPSSVCQPSSPYGNVFFGYGNAYATYEYDDGEVTCGIGQDNANDTNDDLYIYYDDNNGDNAAGANFHCRAYSVHRNYSTIVYEGAWYGCSTTGGCASDPGGSTSSGYIRFADVTHGSDYSVAVSCSIPYPVSGTYSPLYSIRLVEN